MSNKFYIIFSSIFLQFNPYAQDSTLTKELDEVVVSANFQETEIRKAGRNISIITSKQIEMAPVKTLDGILQYALNIDVRARGPLGVQNDISIRGGHYDQTLVLLDGIKLNDPQTGHHTLNLPISLDMIDRIEVLQGGASRVYGPSAFAGAIHIITKKNQTNALNLGLLYGENQLWKGNINFGFNLKKWHNLMSVEQISSEGYAKNTAFRRKNIFYKSGLDIGKTGQLIIEGGWFDMKFGAANFYSNASFNQYEEVSSKLLAVNYLQNVGSNFKTKFSASVRRHNDLYDFNNFRETAPNSVNLHQTDVYDINWINKVESDWGVTTVGLEFRSENVISNRLGETRSTPKAINGSFERFNTALFYTKSKTRNNWSAYLEQWKSWDKLTLSVGTLFNINSQFGQEFFPGIDISYSLNAKHSFYTSTNKSLRFPTFTEMYLTGATVIGDPNLKPEEAIMSELGWKYKSENVSLSSSVFYRSTYAAIDRIKRPQNPIPTMETIGDMNGYGIDFLVKIETKNWIKSEYFKLQNIQLNYARINADRKEDGFQSFYTLNYLSHKGSFGTNWSFGKKLGLDLWYTYKQREGSYQFNAQSPAIAYPPVQLVDARLRYIFGKKNNVFVDGTNILNANYYEFGFVQQPGRWVSLGLNIAIF